MSRRNSSKGGATGNNVYIRDDQYAWVPARLVDSNKETAKVAIPQYKSEENIASDGGAGAVGFKSAVVQLKDYPGRALPLQNCGKDGKLKEVDDMVDLPYLHEAAILYNLKKRHMDGKPYARVADIIIAVNPYQWMTKLYTEKVRQHYAQRIVWDNNETDPRKDLPPHLYEVSSLCYKGLCIDKQNQSILVSGESGAGKTETVKICMNHIATVQQDPTIKKKQGESAVVKRILDSNPLLEAFGNAKTRRNDNSSRFGKYIMLQFHHIPGKGKVKPRAAMVGSTCEVYLLEKSRVVFNEDVERSYHAFYQLLAAPEDIKTKIWKGLKGTRKESFKYIGSAPEVKIDNMSDREWFVKMVTPALQLVGITGEKYLTLWRAIAACMQIGNLTFAPQRGNADQTEITSKKALKDLADLIKCDEKALGLAMTERTMKTRGEEYKVQLKHNISKEAADAFAKEIYAKTFLWLVRAINDATCAENNYQGGTGVEYGIIGLLDIFGFESFPVNGFEQLCINYCNEKLQQKFTRDIFRTVQEEYKAEGLNLDDIKYDDNSDVLELMEGKVGIIKQLNEECVRPKGNDEAFVSKALQSNKTVPCLMQKPTFTRIEFGIHHFAGPVVYRATEFVKRNTDTLPLDLKEVAKQCGNDIISKHLENNKCSNLDGKKDVDTGGRSAPRRAKSNLVADTVMTQFKSQLTKLMTGLNETQSRYVRCVKPNTQKKKLVMQHLTTMEQLRCAGVISAVLISRSAFPSKLFHREVIERYRMLKGQKRGGYSNDKEQVEDLLDKTLESMETTRKDGTIQKGFAIGRTRAYFRSGCLELLEAQRAKIWDKWAVKIQKVVRMFLVKRKIMRQKYEKFAAAVIPIQCLFRLADAKMKLSEAKKDKKRLKRLGKKSRKAAIRIQSIVRMYIQKPRYKALLEKRREENDLKNQLNNIQDKLAEAEEQRVRELEDAKFQFDLEMDEFKEKLEDQLRAEQEKNAKNADQQKTLIDESGKIIEYLRKENMKLRSQCESMKRDYKSLKENNARLMEANASASSSFNQLNDHAKGLNATNARLIKNVDTYKRQLVKMKEDLKNRQAFYLAEAHARVAYQKTLARIVAQVQDKSRDAQLVEDVVIWALECEAEAKSERSALENAGQAAPPGAVAAASRKKSRRPTDDDSDSDSD